MTVAFKRQTESQKLPTWYLTVKCLVINVWVVLLPPAPQTKIISFFKKQIYVQNCTYIYLIWHFNVWNIYYFDHSKMFLQTCRGHTVCCDLKYSCERQANLIFKTCYVKSNMKKFYWCFPFSFGYHFKNWQATMACLSLFFLF